MTSTEQDNSSEVVTLGDQIREWRKARDWSQDELAMAARVSKGYVSAIERNAPHSLTGKSVTPSKEKLDRIAAALAPSPRLVVQYQNRARDLAEYKLINAPPPKITYIPEGATDLSVSETGTPYAPGLTEEQLRQRLQDDAEFRERFESLEKQTAIINEAVQELLRLAQDAQKTTR